MAPDHDSVLPVCDERHERVAAMILDHETRLRAQERHRWLLLVAVTAAAGLGSFASDLLSLFTH